MINHHIVRWTCYAALERERITLTNVVKHGCPPKVANLTWGAVLRKANKRHKVTLEELQRSICYWGHGQHSEEVTLFRKNKQKISFCLNIQSELQDNDLDQRIDRSWIHILGTLSYKIPTKYMSLWFYCNKL